MLKRSHTNIDSTKKEPFKMKYPGLEAYHFPNGPKHESPCMLPGTLFICHLQGRVRSQEERDHDKIEDLDGEQDEQ